MLPYFHFSTINLGPITIQVWGLWVSLGLVAAIVLAYKLAQKYLLSENVILDMATWAVIGAFIMARVFHVIFYEPYYYVTHPAEIIKFWNGGASSLGGFVGAFFAVWIFAKIKKFSWRELLPYFDVAAVSLWLGWGIGRIGCYMINDHPGMLTNLFFGVNYPGGARFDLGLMDSMLGFVLFIIFFVLFKKLIKIRWGLVAGLSFMSYAVVRFFLDFLRATDIPEPDARYWNLTPAQWGMIAVVIGLTFAMFWHKIKRKSSVSPEV
jgi:phosphatidylglycerol:prolipoprotein diacylglycerol transferase